MQWQDLADRVVPILGFLLCITVVAELADRIGVFALLADQVAVLARGSVARLWGLVVVLATLSTAVLSLDTTAVLTPVVLALATQLGLDRAVFAYTTVWLANTASLVLPVSNLTNLLALHVLRLDAPAFASGRPRPRRSWSPSRHWRWCFGGRCAAATPAPTPARPKTGRCSSWPSRSAC